MRALWLLSLAACGEVRQIGPTALVLEVYFSEPLGTKALIISGTAQVDGVPVNVFPTSQRPETLTGAAFPVPQTVRVLLNDTLSGQELDLTVVGVNADGEPVEATTRKVTPVARQETLVAITLRPFASSPNDAGVSDAGITFDAGVSMACQCTSGCCLGPTCATPQPLTLASGLRMQVVLTGPVGQTCTAACPLARASQVVNGQCLCGTSPACAVGLRCEGVGVMARCVCDRYSGCEGCCSGMSTCELGRQGSACGAAGNACDACGSPLCTLRRCPAAVCVSRPNECCSGAGMVAATWPTCAFSTGECSACDVLRSSQCRPITMDTSRSACGCGSNPSCAPEELCVPINGVPTCRKP